jgi:hypothetical protein
MNRRSPMTVSPLWLQGSLVYDRKVSGEGLKPGTITSAEDTRAITALIAWTAFPF